MKKTTWMIIDPVDTLFFRGAESMEAGENHEVDTMFPPMPQTIVGAIRTAVLTQQGIMPADDLAAPEKYPFLGPPEKPGFSLTGPLFLVHGETLLLPAPAHWFADLPDPWIAKNVTVQAASPLRGAPLGLCGSTPEPFWVETPRAADLKSLGGCWATPAVFAKMTTGEAEIELLAQAGDLSAGQAAIIAPGGLFVREERLGIALERSRTARDGHLYSSVHIRLRRGVELAAGIAGAHEIPLAPAGLIQLGGEQRLCRYRLSRELTLPESKGPMSMALSPVAMDALAGGLEHCPRASGKLLRIGGWDMRKKFHKPMRAWLPAGTVFATEINDNETTNFIAI